MEDSLSRILVLDIQLCCPLTFESPFYSHFQSLIRCKNDRLLSTVNGNDHLMAIIMKNVNNLVNGRDLDASIVKRTNELFIENIIPFFIWNTLE